MTNLPPPNKRYPTNGDSADHAFFSGPIWPQFSIHTETPTWVSKKEPWGTESSQGLGGVGVCVCVGTEASEAPKPRVGPGMCGGLLPAGRVHQKMPHRPEDGEGRGAEGLG